MTSELEVYCHMAFRELRSVPDIAEIFHNLFVCDAIARARKMIPGIRWNADFQTD